MKALYLDSVDVDERFLPPAEDDEHREDRESYLRLYQVGDGERVRIRPVIPEVWFGLDTYPARWAARHGSSKRSRSGHGRCSGRGG
jgi:hypothetical protein